MVATLILGLRLRIAEAGRLAVFHENLSGGKAMHPVTIYGYYRAGTTYHASTLLSIFSKFNIKRP